MDLTVRVGLVALLASMAWHQAGTAASSSVSISKERTQECKAAMERIIKEAQKGADANFDSRGQTSDGVLPTSNIRP